MSEYRVSHVKKEYFQVGWGVEDTKEPDAVSSFPAWGGPALTHSSSGPACNNRRKQACRSGVCPPPDTHTPRSWTRTALGKGSGSRMGGGVTHGLCHLYGVGYTTTFAHHLGSLDQLPPGRNDIGRPGSVTAYDRALKQGGALAIPAADQQRALDCAGRSLFGEVFLTRGCWGLLWRGKGSIGGCVG